MAHLRVTPAAMRLRRARVGGVRRAMRGRSHAAALSRAKEADFRALRKEKGKERYH